MTPYCMILLLVLSFPMIKILVFCALSYLQHSYAPFNMLEQLGFPYSYQVPLLSQKVRKVLCGSKKFLSIIAWSSNICIPGNVSKAAMHM